MSSLWASSYFETPLLDGAGAVGTDTVLLTARTVMVGAAYIGGSYLVGTWIGSMGVAAFQDGCQ